MIRIAVCDDNFIQLDIMKELLDEYVSNAGFSIETSAFSSGRKLLHSVKNSGSFDLYILDVIMPDINGFEVATTLRMMNDTGKIIFLTSTREYAIASYDVEAFYYMLKPIDRNKLFSVLDKALSETASSSVGSVFVKTRDGEVGIAVNDIAYVDIADRSLNYHLVDGSSVKGLTLRSSFKEAVSELTADSGRFAFSSISTLVNLSYVDTVDSSGILLDNGMQLYPSRSFYGDFKSAWKSSKTP